MTDGKPRQWIFATQHTTFLGIRIFQQWCQHRARHHHGQVFEVGGFRKVCVGKVDDQQFPRFAAAGLGSPLGGLLSRQVSLNKVIVETIHCRSERTTLKNLRNRSAPAEHQLIADEETVQSGIEAFGVLQRVSRHVEYRRDALAPRFESIRVRQFRR